MAALAGCRKAPSSERPAPAESSAVWQPAPPPTPQPAFRGVRVAGPSGLRKLRRDLGEERFSTVLKLNRLDLDHVRDGDTLVVPDSVRELRAYSPFPEASPSADSLPKLVLVSLRVQAFAAYEGGALVRWGPTSTGRKELPTPRGLYHTNWKAKSRTSTVNDEWLLKWCVNIQNQMGISFHQYDLPGYPASHSCVRLLEDDAKWMYDWAGEWKLSEDRRQVIEQGTPVVIFGEYGFGEEPPWKRLPADPAAAAVAPGDLGRTLATFLPEAAPDTSRVADLLNDRDSASGLDSSTRAP